MIGAYFKNLAGRLNYTHTQKACYLGYICQAVVNNFAPLLFVTFQRQFGISIGSLASLISINFSVQLLVDMASARFVDKIGCRTAALLASAFCAMGLLLMGFLPFTLSSPYAGLLAAVVVNAIGGGILEVIISPIIEALPTKNKSAAMSLLHSFYCWGYVAVVLVSTLYFTAVGIQRWRYLSMFWAILPVLNIFLFSLVPLRPLIEDKTSRTSPGYVFKQKVFFILFLMMVCAGASEQAMAQWSSYFAEAGLGVSKTGGDILGPCSFALLMGGARFFFGRRENIHLEPALFGSGVLCMASYLVAVFSPFPFFSLVGCAVCGLSVGIMWPGIFSLASRVFPKGGTAMFALLALAGDLGCASGPGIVGLVMNGYSLKTGILTAIIFPVLLVSGVVCLKKDRA
jgi:fucose permease